MYLEGIIWHDFSYLRHKHKLIMAVLITTGPWQHLKINAKVKSCYNPLRLGTVIVLVSSGIDFVNTPRLYSDRATR